MIRTNNQLMATTKIDRRSDYHGQHVYPNSWERYASAIAAKLRRLDLA